MAGSTMCDLRLTCTAVSSAPASYKSRASSSSCARTISSPTVSRVTVRTSLAMPGPRSQARMIRSDRASATGAPTERRTVLTPDPGSPNSRQ
jgi:hypothetical protein